MRQPVFDVEEDSDEEEDDIHVKNVVVVGKKKSGKSSIITRLVRNSFTLCYTPTKSIEIYPPVLIGTKYYKFYEIPYSYDFNHQFFIAAHVVFIVEEVESEWWAKLMSTVDPKLSVEVYFLTQKNLKLIHRQYKVDALAFSGFSNLMYDIQKL